MDPARLTARAAASLLVALPCSATVVTLPVDGAVAALAWDVDTDGDGLPDAGDGCPTVASTNPTGCPTAARTVELTYHPGRNRLQARVTSPVRACASHARISLWRVRPQRDVKLLGVEATSRGRYRFRVPRGPTYYVTVSASYSSGVAECTGAASGKVRVPRA